MESNNKGLVKETISQEPVSNIQPVSVPVASSSESLQKAQPGIKRPSEQQLVPVESAKKIKLDDLASALQNVAQNVASAYTGLTTMIPKDVYTYQNVELGPQLPPITGQFSALGNIVDTELTYLTSKLRMPNIDKDTKTVYELRLQELQNQRSELADLSNKLNAVSGDKQMAEFYKQKATNLLYAIDKNSQFGKLATDAAERLNILQRVYAPNKELGAAGPLSVMSTALFSMPDLNNDGIVDEQDLRTGTDAGDFDRNLAIRDADGQLLLYSTKYDFNKLDRIGRFAYDDMKDFALKLAREGLDIGNRLPAGTNFSFRREGIPNFADFEKWPEDFKQKYYDYVYERAQTGTGYQKLQSYAELIQKKPYAEWTDQERKDFIKFQDAYVITDNNYGTYLVTRDNPQWNANDAVAYNKQLAAGGNRYFVDHNTEYLMKVIKPIVIAGNVVATVATFGTYAVGLVASTIGNTLGALGAASSFSIGSTLPGAALAVAFPAAGAATTGGLLSAVTGFASTVAATGGENIVQLGQSILSGLAPKAGELVVQTSVREIAKAAGADAPTLAVLDAVGELSGNIVGAGVSGIQGALVGNKLTKAVAFDTLKTALKQNLTGTKLVEFMVNGTEKLVKEYAPKNIKDLPSLTKLVSASLNGEDILPVMTNTMQEFAQSSIVLGNSAETASNFIENLNRYLTGIRTVEGLMGSNKTSFAESLAVAFGQDYLLNHLPKVRGQEFKSPVEEEYFKKVSKEAYSSNPPSEIGPYKLSYSSDTIKVYVDPDTRRLMLGIRGTSDSRDKMAWVPTGLGAIKSTDRYNYDKVQVESIIQRFPPSQYNYFITGHSLGGAIATEMRRQYPFIQKAVVYNSATSPQDVLARDAEDVKRIFFKSDILYNLQGGKLTASEVRGGSYTAPDDPLLAVIGMVQGHKMNNFFVDERRSADYNY